MQPEIISVSADTLVGEVARAKFEGFRFVTLSCTESGGDSVDILYHFDKDLRLKHLRLSVLKCSTVPSISAVYFAAFLVENEIQDLFGVRFEGLVVDYERTLYLDPEVAFAPFCTVGAQNSNREQTVTQPGTADS
ncbi:MAG: NADH-quinone oxidoreductase subunit C [Deltaproteobacteria bacterium]|jgi:ech hydrogenase subunit D|nr:NADH-quinone oxidoreductase subunit C [Deltaproteobacteria bacterium]